MSIIAPGRMRIPQLAVTNRTLTANDISTDEDGVETGKVRTDLTGAIVYFTVTDENDVVVLQKISTDSLQIEIHADQVTEATKGTAIVHFYRADTAPLTAGGDYTFDSWVKTQDGREEPIVDCGKFIVDKSKTDILNSPVPDLPTSPGSQTPQQRAFKYTLLATSDSHTITIPGTGMVDANYCIMAHIEDRNGGLGAVLETPTAQRTTTQFQLECSGAMTLGAVINFILKDSA